MDTMKNLALIVVALLLIAAGAFWFFNRTTAEPAVEDEVASEQDDTVEGVIIGINREGVAADGPTLIELEQRDGTEVMIAVPSMGINLCAAASNITDVFALETGTRLEVRGSISPEGYLVPCEDARHYVKVISS